MKTCFCWDTCGERTPLFFELEGDYRHFNGIYIKGDEKSEARADELAELVLDKNTGEMKLPVFGMPPSRDWDYFITCGFIP